MTRRKRVARAIAFGCLWVCGTTAATILVGPKDNTPGPLEVLTVSPAHAKPVGTYHSDTGDAVRRAQAQHDNNVRLLQAAALIEAARKATTTTTTVRRVAPTPAPVAPRPVSGDCSGWLDLVDDYAWDVSRACRILACESGGNAGATGVRVILRGLAYRAYGLMQILRRDGDVGGLYDPKTNMDAAYSLYTTPRSWGHWTCR